MANKLVISCDQEEHNISRHLYGHFAEHLGRCIYEGIWVGEKSAIPNINGIRTDVVEALREIKMPNLRWPGGCFADEYHWKNGIGPSSKRAKTVNTHWGKVIETNHFGTHEFMELCRQLECEPYICGNVGSGSPREMQDWVEYLTFGGDSTMAGLRRTNGREQPWQINYWGVGNENWACGGNMRAGYYADQYRRYQTFLKNYGEKKLYRIACGAYGEDYNWTEVLMREAASLMDGLSLHYYVFPGTWQAKGSATDFQEKQWFVTLKKALFMEELIQKHGTIMDKYDPEKRVGLIVDEWGAWHDVEPGTNPGFLFQQNTLRDALVAGLTLNILNRHADRVKMSNIAQTVNVLQSMLLTDGEKMIKTPTYHIFKMFAVHQESISLPVHVSSADYTFENEVVQAINISASRSAEGLIHLSTCNLDPQNSMKIRCEFRGIKPAQVSAQVLTATEMNAHNSFSDPDAVKPVAFSGVKLSNAELAFEQPAKSVVMLEVSA